MFKGVIVPLATPFNEDYTLDLEGLEWLLNFLYEKGVHGVFVNSTTGESVHLTRDEVRGVTARAVESVGGKLKVLAGASANSTLEAVELGLMARDLGVDGIVVTPPYYFKHDQEALFRHYSDIASRVEIPLIIYNIPSLTGVSVEPQTVARLAGEHSNIVSIKATIDSVSYLRRVLRAVKALRRDFTVLTGLDDHLFNTLVLGGDGGVFGCANFAPQLHLGLYRAFLEGRLDDAVEYARKLAALSEVYSVSGGFPLAVKVALRVIGAPIKPVVRPPLTYDPTVEDKVRSILSDAGVI